MYLPLVRVHTENFWLETRDVEKKNCNKIGSHSCSTFESEKNTDGQRVCEMWHNGDEYNKGTEMGQ